MVAECRCLAFADLGLRPLDAFNRIVADGILFAEIFKQRRQRREAVPHRGAALNVFAPAEVVAPGDDMRSGHRAEFFRPDNAGEPHEITDRVLIGAPGAAISDIGEPFDLRRHICQALKLGGGQKPLGRGDLGWKLGVSLRVGHTIFYS
jgi:hypothetical protein